MISRIYFSRIYFDSSLTAVCLSRPLYWYFTFPTHIQVDVPRWRASPAAWRKPWIQGIWSRMLSITSRQLISSTPSSPPWTAAAGRPCPGATVTSARAGTMRRLCCSALMMSSETLAHLLQLCQRDKSTWTLWFILHLFRDRLGGGAVFYTGRKREIIADPQVHIPSSCCFNKSAIFFSCTSWHTRCSSWTEESAGQTALI